MILSANILPIIAWDALFPISFSSMGPAVAPGVSHWPPGGAAAHSLILKGPQLPLAPSKQGVKKSLKIQADEIELLLLLSKIIFRFIALSSEKEVFQEYFRFPVSGEFSICHQ